MLSRLAALALTLGIPASAGAAEPAKPVEVMVLGMYHMSNPGLDVNNAKADDVLTPHRQREIEILVDELARFRPTRIMVERVGQGPELTPQSWTEFNPQALTAQRDETVQIGYRLANKLNIPVHGIDERDRPGEDSYFPFDKVMAFLNKRGEKSQIETLNAPIQAHIKKFEAAQATKPVAGLLVMWNDPSQAPRDMDFYYGSLRWAEGMETPGADLNARWYLRNLRIFTNLMQQSKPGDRVLVVYGSGHSYWLRHLATETPGFRNIDPLPYLERAASPRR